jgi:hypothetical protein
VLIPAPIHSPFRQSPNLHGPQAIVDGINFCFQPAVQLSRTYRRTTPKEATKSNPAFGIDPNMPVEEVQFDVLFVLASDLPRLS